MLFYLNIYIDLLYTIFYMYLIYTMLKKNYMFYRFYGIKCNFFLKKKSKYKTIKNKININYSFEYIKEKVQKKKRKK